VAEGTDRHDENDDNPDRMRIEGAERSHWLIWQNWQHDQCGGGEDQGIPDLIFAQYGTRKTVERGARVEQYGDGHCDARGKPRPGNRKSAEHCR